MQVRVIGDDTYGKRPNARLKELTDFAAARQMLHAHQLTLTHPGTGKKLHCTAPWPADFQKALETLRLPG